jgi:hypothetical protein
MNPNFHLEHRNRNFKGTDDGQMTLHHGYLTSNSYDGKLHFLVFRTDGQRH